MKVKLQPPSSTELPAFNPILPPAAVTQILLLANPHKVFSHPSPWNVHQVSESATDKDSQVSAANNGWSHYAECYWQKEHREGLWGHTANIYVIYYIVICINDGSQLSNSQNIITAPIMSLQANHEPRRCSVYTWSSMCILFVDNMSSHKVHLK